MVRKSGSIPTSLWYDNLFRSHSASQKLLYAFLLTHPKLNAGGLIVFAHRAWADLVGSDPDMVRSDIAALGASHLVEVDYEEDEVFVSGYFAAESIGRQPRRAAGALKVLNQSYSKKLRAIGQAELADEVRRGYEHTPSGVRAVVLERDGYRCCKCGWKPGGPVTAGASSLGIFRGLEVDHVYPKALGGSSDLSNLQTLCSLCNSLKGAKV
jgi:5-methylcytosine-specific restriction endonuclease McrA